jgi:hypothetical protein
MKKLVERSDGSTRLISIPSMSNPQYWCREVVTMVNAGRGRVRLYAKVMNPELCPKYLKVNKQVYQHGSNHSMVMVVEEKHPDCKATSIRMFTRCFSEKCRGVVCHHNAGGWVELSMEDYLIMRMVKTKAV